jgi:hypothetical protein
MQLVKRFRKNLVHVINVLAQEPWNKSDKSPIHHF